jgi:hypothetical protein
LKDFVSRVIYILRHEGWIALTMQVFNFVSQRLFQYGNYYLYEHIMTERNEADFLPKFKNFTAHMVTSAQQGDELKAQGYNIYTNSINTRNRLDKGAIAFCVFIEKDLAHIGWSALTEKGMESFEPFPYRVNFDKQEACTGGTETVTKYEGHGLMTYGYFKRFQFLYEKGTLISKNLVGVNNTASQKVHSKFIPLTRTKTRYIKILWWHNWKMGTIENQ